MLSSLRKILDNWVARGFFALLIAIFVFWGISNVFTLSGSSSAVAHIGGKPVDVSQVQANYQTALANLEQSSAGQPALQARQQLAQTALESVLRQQALALEAQRLGIVAPDAAIRQMLYGIPAFQTNGVFDKAKFAQVLQANNVTPEKFLGDVRNNILNSQIIIPAALGAGPPAALVTQVFQFVAEQRFAETVTIPFSAQKPPAAPADAVLQRYWKNHPATFTAPAYRTIQLVILSPALLAHTEQVSDADVADAYARATAGQAAVPLRSVEVITTDNAKAASGLAAAWNQGADWTKMQALAAKAGASPVELDKAQQSDFPSPELGKAVFAAPPGQVTGPVQGPLGYFVLKVTDVAASGQPQAALQAEIKQQLQLQKAQSDVAQDVDNVQDALAGHTELDKLPGNLGLVAVEGTLDANGNAQDGTPAPIPGGADLKVAIVKAAFAAQVNDPAQLIDGPDGSYFALTVESTTPPSVRDYDSVKTQVLAAWTQDQIVRAAEIKAAGLYQAVNGTGQSLDDAASAAGYAVTMSPAVTRNAPPSGMANELVQVLFSLKQGQATMLQSDTGFTVATLANIVHPNPQDDPSDFTQAQQAMTKGVQNDVAESLISGLLSRDNVSENQQLLAEIYQ